MTVLQDFLRHAESAPERLALTFTRPGTPDVETATYKELRGRTELLAAGLRAEGLRSGDRVIVASPLSVDFFALSIALVGSGMELVLIDGRMDRRRLLGALRAARARAVVSTGAALRRWPLITPLWRTRRYAVDGAPLGVRPFARLVAAAPDGAPAEAGADATAIISFTSGSAGRAKGVVRTNGILLAQHEALARHLPYGPGDVDMTCFPAVVLHNLACGIGTVLPPVDLREPASVDPAAAVAVARRTGVTTLSGAPAYMERIAVHLRETGTTLPAVRRVVVGGAPVPRRLCAALTEVLPHAEALVVYGSTEAEPIAHVAMRDVLTADGEGMLVGTAVPEVEVELVALPERLDRALDPAEFEGFRSETGEVLVRGAGVSRAYVGDHEAVARNKVRIAGGDGDDVWHRTGDVARRDPEGRLWLLGRISDLVVHHGRVLHPLPLEAALAELEGVRRAALVAHGAAPDGELAVVAEDPGALARVRHHLLRAGLGDLPVRAVAAIPTDARHNSKIDRATLRTQLLGSD